MKKIYILTLIIIPSIAVCQTIPSNIRAQISAERLVGANWSRPGNAIVGIPIPPGRVIGDTYLDSKWNLGSVMVADKNTVIEGYPLKYDIKGQSVEIKTATGVRILAVKNVGHMVWLDSITQQPRYFVNAAKFKDDGVPMIGLLEVVADGHRALLRKTVVNTKSPTYVPAMDVGSRDTEIIKKSLFLYNEGEEVIEIKSKKKLVDSFGDAGDDMGKFIKENKLDAKSEDDLVKIFDYYNTKFPPTN